MVPTNMNNTIILGDRLWLRPRVQTNGYCRQFIEDNNRAYVIRYENDNCSNADNQSLT